MNSRQNIIGHVKCEPARGQDRCEHTRRRAHVSSQSLDAAQRERGPTSAVSYVILLSGPWRAQRRKSMGQYGGKKPLHPVQPRVTCRVPRDEPVYVRRTT